MTAIDGVLPVDKPSGPTSHDIVSAVRRQLWTKKVGHTGTLDPFASGLLLLCLGPSTRLSEYLTALPKSYRATMVLGVGTDTDDREGTVISQDDGWQEIDESAVVEALTAQVGDILQTPPSYSAKRVGGRRLYEAAREGEPIAVDPVPVNIKDIKLISFDPPNVQFDVECGSGTYIRAIARDVGQDLGVGAHLSVLRRTRVGDFSVESAVQLDDLADPEKAVSRVVPPAEAVAHLGKVEAGSGDVAALQNGRKIAVEGSADGGPIAAVDRDGRLLAIGENADGYFQPRKVLI